MDPAKSAQARGWFGLLIGAFSLSREAGWAMLLGLVAQWVRTRWGLPTDAMQGGCIVACVLCWCFLLGHPVSYPIPREWWGPFGEFTLAALGTAAMSREEAPNP